MFSMATKGQTASDPTREAAMSEDTKKRFRQQQEEFERRTALRERTDEFESRQQRETPAPTLDAPQGTETYLRLSALRWSFEWTVVPGPDTIQ
jgi:hypothetical protein